jgi:hypothetical protein
MKRHLLFCMVLLSLMLTGCNSFRTPPPGWRDPVYRLLLQEASFPTGWNAGYDIPEYIKDPTTNHVSMEWLYADGGLVYQSIWRAYTIEDAKSKFMELKQPKREPVRTLTPDTKYVPFAPPSEIKFNGTKADEFYITCGWLDYPYCVTIARYRNYVVALTATFSGTMGNYTHVEGLTYPEIEALIRDMDKIMGTIQK